MIWAYLWIISKVLGYDITVYVTGIDMSSAFDTIHCEKLLDIIDEVFGEDERRMARLLLTNTTLEVRVNGAETVSFKSNMGPLKGTVSVAPFSICTLKML